MLEKDLEEKCPISKWNSDFQAFHRKIGFCRVFEPRLCRIWGFEVVGTRGNAGFDLDESC
jgi:hypothetical protein